MIKSIFTLTFSMLIMSLSLNGQLVINEYSASNLRSFEDNHNDHEDWIELYNNSDEDINISGFHLSDKDSKPSKWAFPANTILGAREFLLIWASGRDIVKDGHFHTNFKFTQTKGDEWVVLADRNGNIIEKTALKITQLAHSVCKENDGSGDWMITTEPTPLGSNIESRKYRGYAESPAFDSLSGYYASTIKVNIISDTAKYFVRYTINGNQPKLTSTKYTGIAINVIKETVIKARNFPKDTTLLPSQETFSTFFVKAPSSTLPILSVAGDNLLALANGNKELRPFGTLEVFGKDMKRISISYGEVDSHGQDSWVNDQRSLDWISRDEMGLNNSIPQKLFNYSDRDSYQRIILRASGDDNYPATNGPEHNGSAHVRDEYVHTLVQQSGMRMDVRALERYNVYLNGRYWGVYTIREKPDDHDYIDYTYNQDKFDIQFLKTWGQSWIEYGGLKSQEDWIVFRDSVLNNDLSTPVMQKYIEDNLDIYSLYDYMLANLAVVSSDWLNYNTGWWRGLDKDGKHKKWGYIMWDNDATFDYYINYSGVPNTQPNAKACDINDIASYMDVFFPQDTTYEITEADSFFVNGQWIYFPADTFTRIPDLGKHEKIFLKMLDENEYFRTTYLRRYIDMNSVAFSCENMLSTLDSLINIIKPEMPRHIQRWTGGSLNEWNGNVSKLRKFVEERCELINQGLSDCYNLTGPFKLTLMTDPPGAAEIKLNTINHKNLPWVGNYQGSITHEVEVKTNQSAPFVKWKSKSGSIVINNTSSLKTEIELTESDTLVAVFANATSTNETVTSAFTITPNPATDHINVDNENEEILSYTVIDLLGKIILKGNAKGQNSLNINVINLQSGLYVLKLNTLSGAKYSTFEILK